jgi:hypothetical protein
MSEEFFVKFKETFRVAIRGVNDFYKKLSELSESISKIGERMEIYEKLGRIVAETLVEEKVDLTIVNGVIQGFSMQAPIFADIVLRCYMDLKAQSDE